ncbi:MAG: SURF1 family cytochrome oxidase biogenesis protein [Xanthobacteraceae bacterium]|nr:SURF1 family cytochrome oxidase biogenesis protein [Xanthobacteraceae bacterium]
MAAIVSSRRGVIGFGIVTLVMLACLVSIGVWQLQRRAQKHVLIAALTERLAAEPVALPPPGEWAALTPERDEFRRVTVRAQPQSQPHAFVFTSGSPLRPDVSGLGVWEFAPMRTASGQTVVVNLGFVPDGKVAPDRNDSEPRALTGYLRFPEQVTAFTPIPDLVRRTWYLRDSAAMAQTLEWGEVAPFYVDLEAPVPSSGLPKPGPLQVRLRDQHLHYAVTWFGLAAVVAAAFGFWVAGQRRAR